ncbi:MAG TPA: hypothetical protein VF972_11100 [Actinomycetota bacterium]
MFRRGGSTLTLIWVIVGAFVAGHHNYLQHVHTLRAVVAGLLAMFLWPLVLLHVNLHLGT